VSRTAASVSNGSLITYCQILSPASLRVVNLENGFLLLTMVWQLTRRSPYKVRTDSL